MQCIYVKYMFIKYYCVLYSSIYIQILWFIKYELFITILMSLYVIQNLLPYGLNCESIEDNAFIFYHLPT